MTILASSFLIGSSLFLQVTRTTINSGMGLKFGKIEAGPEELAALERLKKLMHSLVTTPAPLFLIGSSSYLQVTRTTIKSRMGSKFSRSDLWLVT